MPGHVRPLRAHPAATELEVVRPGVAPGRERVEGRHVARRRHREAQHAHAADPLLAGRIVVGPGAVVERARRQHGHVDVARRAARRAGGTPPPRRRRSRRRSGGRRRRRASRQRRRASVEQPRADALGRERGEPARRGRRPSPRRSAGSVTARCSSSASSAGSASGGAAMPAPPSVSGTAPNARATIGRSCRIASTSGTQKPSCSEQHEVRRRRRARSSCSASSSTEPRNGSRMRRAAASRRQALP